MNIQTLRTYSTERQKNPMTIKDVRWLIFKVKRFFCNVVIYNPQGPKET